MEAAQQEVAAAETALRTAEADYDRTKALADQDVVPKQRYDHALMQFETIDANQIDDIMLGQTPREPKGWSDTGGDSGSAGSNQAEAEEEDSSDPIGGPAGEH